MAKIRITQDNLLTPEELKKKLEEIEENTSPMDDMLDLMREMITFEQQHKVSSEAFYERFIRGEMGDARPFIQWAIRYELYLNIKEKIESHMNAMTGGDHADKVLVPAV